MARYTEDHKPQTRQAILRAARRMLQSRGVAGTAIPALMAEAGLTHGGFYAHFRNKTDLLAQVCAAALRRRTTLLTEARQGPRPRAELAEFVDYYLGAEHRDSPASGCILPSVASEIARQEPEVRHALTGAIEEYVAALAALLPEDDSQPPTDQALVLASGMAGAVLLARTVDDPQLSDRILAAAHHFYKDRFAPDAPGA